MHDQYVTLIAELDKTLSLAREMWMEARDDTEKRKGLLRLNQLLDERIRLMKARDAAQAVTPKVAVAKKRAPRVAPSTQQPPTNTQQ